MNPNKPTVPPLNRKPMIRPSGKAMPHDMTPVRFVNPIPGDLPTPPVRAKAYRKTKDRNAPVGDPFGDAQRAGDARDERMPRD